jgi:hypothetical protein
MALIYAPSFVNGNKASLFQPSFLFIEKLHSKEFYHFSPTPGNHKQGE